MLQLPILLPHNEDERCLSFVREMSKNTLRGKPRLSAETGLLGKANMNTSVSPGEAPPTECLWAEQLP